MKKINVVDIFIILFVFLSIVGIGIRIGTDIYLNKKNNVEYQVMLKVENIDHVKENAVAKSDKVYFSNSLELLGEIESVEFTPRSSENGASSDGPVMNEVKYDMLCVVNVKGTSSDNGFMIEGGKYIFAGMTLEIKTPGYEGVCTVMGISNKK